MGILFDEKINIKPNKCSKYYQSLGYETNGPNTFIEIKVKDLIETSTMKIPCICDFCNTRFLKERRTIKNIYEPIACKHCSIYKAKTTIINKYGVDSVFKSAEVRDKIKTTWMNNYGVDNPNKSNLIIEKRCNTNLIKYGNRCSMNGSNKYKSEQTLLKKYNVNHISKTQLYKEKFKNTCMQRYGVTNPMKCPIIKEKSMLNRNVHNNNISKQQIYINNLLNGEINKYINGYYADIFLKNINIIIEYDGSGHWFGVKHHKISLNEFEIKETKRQNLLIENGCKIIRIISRKDLLPKDIELLNIINGCINILLNSNVNLIKIDIDDLILKIEDNFTKISFSELRKITKEDINV